MLVNAEYPAVQVPQGFASDGQIVLNISPSAVRSLHMDNEAVSFEGRFGGVPTRCMCRMARSWVLCPGERPGHGLRAGVRRSMMKMTCTMTMSSRMTMAARGQPAAARRRPSLKVVK
jgi:stringent starvation protein B